jgi:hypothetical protein
VIAARSYAFGPGLRLRITGEPAVLDHFDAEYGSAAVPEGEDVQLELAFGDALDRNGEDLLIRGGHKTVGWQVALSSADADPLRTCVHLSGRPRSFGLSLVQGYFLEPLLSVAASRTGLVLLPSAAVAVNGEALLLVGRSRTGKSSLSVRAAAAGRPVLGDDQILLDDSGRCASFPRRLRFYSDLRETAPAAHARLPRSVRTALTLRRILKLVTRGFAAPPVRVPLSLFGLPPPQVPLPLIRIAVIRRSSSVAELETAELATDRAVEEALDVLAEQRFQLAAAGDPDWQDALAETIERERAILALAFADCPVLGVSVPDQWSAPRAIAALADLLGTERAATRDDEPGDRRG